MLSSLVTIVLTVGAGAVLASVPKNGGAAFGSIRTFALTAAASIVLIHFLPHALEGLGLGALLLVAAGIAVPHLLESGLSRVLTRTRGDLQLGLEAGFWGLVAHSVGDGFALASAESRGFPVLLGIAAHTVPVVAFVVLTFQEVEGRAGGLRRSLWLAIASAAGVVLYRSLSTEWFSVYGSVFDAVVAGLLLHVVAHELGHELPSSTQARVAEACAGAAGLVLVVASTALGEEPGHAEPSFFPALLSFSIQSAPALLLALGAGALLSALSLTPSLAPVFGARTTALASAVSGMQQALRSGSGSSLDPLGLLKNEPVPQRRAFLLAFHGLGPALAAEGWILSAGLLGLVSTLVWVSLTLGMVLLMALWLGRRGSAPVVPRPSFAPAAAVSFRRPKPEAPRFTQRFFLAIERLSFRLGASILLGLLLGAQIQTYVAPQAEPSLLLTLAAVSLPPLLAVSTGPCLVSALLVASAMAHQGVGTSTLLIGLALATFANPALLAWIHRQGGSTMGGVLGGALLAVVVGLTWIPGTGIGGLGSEWIRGLPGDTLGRFWGLFLGFVLAQGVFRVGLRGWLAATFELHVGAETTATGKSCSCHRHHHPGPRGEPWSRVDPG